MSRPASPTAAAIAAAILIAAPAMAAGPLEIASTVMVETRQNAPDRTTRVVLAVPRKVVPGDRVVFVLTYRNTGTQPLGNVVLANPVPGGIAYRAPAQGSVAPEVSVGGKVWGAFGTVRTADGSRAAAPDEITHIRWRIARAVAPGERGSFAFQAVVK